MRAIRRTPLILMLAVLMILPVSGCKEKLTSVSEAQGLFHVKVPESWQEQVSPGLMVFYASEELPESEAESFETLSVGIYTASAEATGSVPDSLEALLKARAEERKWSDHTISEPEEMKIGGRTGYSSEVVGKDGAGRPFAGRAVLVSTSGSQVLVFAVSPKDSWDDDSSAVDDLMREWYWHKPASAESTPSADS